MTSQDKDIVTISKRLLNPDFDHAEMNEALAALDRLLKRTLPDLPDGYEVRAVREVNNRSWLCEIEDGFGKMKDEFGDSPRSAVLAALEKIGD